MVRNRATPREERFGKGRRDASAGALLPPARWRDLPAEFLKADALAWSLDTLQAHAGLAEFDMHYGLEFGIVLVGRMHRYWSSWEAEVGPGQVWLCGMWEPHGWRVTSAACQRLLLVIPPAILARARFPQAPQLDWMGPFSCPPQRRPQARGAMAREVLALACRFEQHALGAVPPADSLAALLLLEVLLVLMEDRPAGPPTRRVVPAEYYGAVNRAAQIALESRQHLTAAEVARQCGLGPRVFGAVFADLMGTSFARFALRSRLSEVARELRGTDVPIGVIAASWGFRHPGQFRRHFQQHYGLSPSQYRRRDRQAASS